MQVAAVILAAGASTRFGSPKQLVRIGGRTMLDIVAGTAREAGLEPLVVVVPPELEAPDGAVRVVNPAPEEGISRSIRLGLEAVPAEAKAAVILLGDEPTLAPESLLEVLIAAEDDGADVVATRAGERLGPPVLLRRSAFGLAESLRGDHGLGAILRSLPDLAVVQLDEAPVDVDTPADLDAAAEACPGCGVRYVPMPGAPTHDYIGASPACWAAYGRLLAREFEDPAYFALHRQTVDAYAAQHPGSDGRRQRQSVAVHLIGLCHWLEHGLDGERLIAATRALTTHPRDWPWLDPPAGYRLTVVDVLGARSAAEHVELVREWAASVWEAWSAHHETVRRWAAEALTETGAG